MTKDAENKPGMFIRSRESVSDNESCLPKGNGGLAFGAPEGGPDSELSIVPKKKPQQINVLTLEGIQNMEPREAR